MTGIQSVSVTYDGDATVLTDASGLASGISIPSGTTSGTLTIFKTGYQTITVPNFTPVAGQTYAYQLIPVGVSTFAVHAIDNVTGSSITNGTAAYAGGTPVALDSSGLATLPITQASGTLVVTATGYGTITETGFTPTAGTQYGIKLTPNLPATTSGTLTLVAVVIAAILALIGLGR